MSLRVGSLDRELLDEFIDDLQVVDLGAEWLLPSARHTVG